MQHQIVFLDRESVGANVRKPEFPHSYKEYEATWTPEEILERLKDATIAIINKVPMRADTLKQLPKLKLIAVAATGTDVVDKAYCKEHGITVGVTFDVTPGSRSMATLNGYLRAHGQPTIE